MKRPFCGRKPRAVLPSGTIDTQMHLYPEGHVGAAGAPPLPPDPPGAPEYEQVMRWLGIDRVVVTQSNAYGADNVPLLAGLEQLGSKARGVAVVTPGTSHAQIRAWHEAGVRGARIMDLPGGAVGTPDAGENSTTRLSSIRKV